MPASTLPYFFGRGVRTQSERGGKRGEGHSVWRELRYMASALAFGLGIHCRPSKMAYCIGMLRITLLLRMLCAVGQGVGVEFPGETGKERLFACR